MKSFLSVQFRVSLLLGMLCLGLLVERLRPLRRVTQSKMHRVAINLGLAAVGAVVLRFGFFPIVFRVSQQTVENHWGLFSQLELPGFVEVLLAILALDYTLYIWHWMNHKIPFLWRFHNVHHVDLDLDVSTASRFHFGELILSTGFRSGQALVFGIDPFTLILFETLVTTAAQFHHSNIRLPIRLERILNKVIVTPRMHGIHHSIVQEETDSNYSTIFSFWDRLHRSVRLNVRQSDVTIGVAVYRDENELSFIKSLWMPFGKQRAWRLPDGVVPRRLNKESSGSGALSA